MMILLALPVTFQRPALVKVALFQISPTVGIVHLDLLVEQPSALPALSPSRYGILRRGMRCDEASDVD